MINTRLQCRHVLTILAFFGLVNVYTMRMNLGVAIVAMVKVVNKSKPALENGTSIVDQTCRLPEEQNVSRTDMNTREGEFYWNEYTQGIILGCFFYSYVITNFVGGRISEVVGVKLTFGVGILSTSILTILTPVVARWHYLALIALRILEGLMEGLTFPAIHCMMGRWYPKQEWAFVYSIIHAGSSFGSLISLPISGILSYSTFLGGWPSSFYVFGILGLIWVLLWFLFMYEFPEDHPRITPAELNFIKEGIGENVASRDKPLPWLAIITSIPVWACAVASFGKNWVLNTIQINIPTYLKNILHFDIAQSGILSSVPVLFETILSVVAGFLSDFALEKKVFTVHFARKFFTATGLLVGSLCLFLIQLFECDRTVIIVLLTIATGFAGFSNVGYLIAIIDMSPIYSGTVMGIVNAIGQLSGFLAPFTVGVLTNEEKQTSGQWFKVFYISAIMSVISTTSFVVFGRTTLQPWSKDQPKKDLQNKNADVVLTHVRKYQ